MFSSCLAVCFQTSFAFYLLVKIRIIVILAFQQFVFSLFSGSIFDDCIMRTNLRLSFPTDALDEMALGFNCEECMPVGWVDSVC